MFHVDMDAFYAAVEVRDRPRLRGLPVVVGADPQGGRGRGVVCTASYEARAYGIRSAMPISQAYRLAPHAVFLRPDFARYSQASDAVMQVLDRYADALEVVGLDEAYLDVTERCGNDWGWARTLALSLQAAVRRETGLSCSIGVAPSKAVAKVATDCRKPHGITQVRPGEAQAFLAAKPVRVLAGCGPKTAARLAKMGYRTVADLAAQPPARLEALLGSHGLWLHQMAQGRDLRPVDGDRGPRKSRGNETTFQHDQRDPGHVVDTALALLDELVHEQGRRDRRAFATLTVKVRYAGFATLTRQATPETPLETDDPVTPQRAQSLVRSLLGPLLDGRPVRLVGVRLSGFRDPSGQRRLPGFGVACAPPPARPARPRPSGVFDPGGLRWGRLPVVA